MGNNQTRFGASVRGALGESLRARTARVLVQKPFGAERPLWYRRRKRGGVIREMSDENPRRFRRKLLYESFRI